MDDVRRRIAADPRLHGEQRTAADSDAAVREYLAECQAIATAAGGNEPASRPGQLNATDAAKFFGTVAAMNPEQRHALDLYFSGGDQGAIERSDRHFRERQPEGSAPAPSPASAPAPAPAAGPVWPVHARISQEFGGADNHPGMDIAAAQGTPIQAATAGKVVQAGDNGDGYGNCVVIEGDDGTFFRYGHQSEVRVAVGDHVDGGQEIGLVGSTGQSTGPHLHLEVRTGGQWGQTHNPRDYINGNP